MPSATTITVSADEATILPALTPTTLLSSKDDKRRALLQGQSTCSLTESETSIDSVSSSSSSSSTIEEEEQEIQLITKRSRSSNSFARAARAFPSLNAANQTSLSLTNFVARSTRHDIYALRDAILQQDSKLTSLTLEDTVSATGFRRWAYKLANVSHHIQKLCLERGIALEYHAQMELDVDDMSHQDALAMIAEIRKQPEIRRLHVLGHLNLEQTKATLKAVTSLLKLDDRDWDAANIHIGFAPGNDQEDYEAWRELMMEYMQTFSQLYTKYSIPIDIRPCAN